MGCGRWQREPGRIKSLEKGNRIGQRVYRSGSSLDVVSRCNGNPSLLLVGSIPCSHLVHTNVIVHIELGYKCLNQASIRRAFILGGENKLTDRVTLIDTE